MKRVFIEILILIGLLVLFAIKVYEFVPAPLQLVALKAMEVSMGLLHAHLARKFLIPVKADWEAQKMEVVHYVAIAFYIAVPYFYAIGG